ncbi:hypothetical protein ABZ484_00730 [Streptomyces sp. NPDC006393]|uniref:hypothetical protein n=1 Tax=Streptomyces sp. NPDC006393 TaxID=3156763 RepID=UPI0033C93E8E
MIEQQRQQSDHAREARRRAGVGWFVGGVVAALCFFAFFPGMPHVVDWGAVLVSLGVGALARWGCRSWMSRARGKGERVRGE